MKTDLRVVKTHQSIRNALIDLLTEQSKSFEEIGIQDILQTAMVNRATFYKYYAGKKDLAKQMIDAFKKEYATLLQQRLDTPNLNDFLQQNKAILFSKRKLLLALWKIDTDRLHLYQDMHEMIANAFIQQAEKQQGKTKPWQYQATIAATLILTTAKYYFEQNEVIPFPKVFQEWQEMIDILLKSEE